MPGEKSPQSPVLTRIELTNFMSHARTVIEPAAGLTVLVGPNNCGKSAVVAALQILAYNESSTYVLRHGERECSVEVTTSEGHVVRWGRKTAPSYRINGQLFDRLRGAALPEPLHQTLRLPEVTVGESSSFDIHFGSQKSPIFLLDKANSAAAKFFASSSDASRLLEMQKRHKERLAEREGEKKRLEAESKQLTAVLEALQPAPAIDRAVRDAEEAHAALVQLAADIDQAVEDHCRLEIQTRAVACHAERSTVLSALSQPPELDDPRPIVQMIGDIAESEKVALFTSAKAETLVGLPGPPALAETGDLAGYCAALQRQSLQLEHASARQRTLENLLPAPQLADTQDLQRVAEDLSAIQQAVQNGARRGAALAGLASPPLLDDTADLATLLGRIEQATRECEKQIAASAAARIIEPPPAPVDVSHLAELNDRLALAATDVEQQTRQLAAATEALAEAAAALREAAMGSACPLCGSELDPDRLLALAASGGHGHA
jgi:exonuclease SbcC